MTTEKRRLRALMTLAPIAGERDEIPRGTEYEATPQQARDDLRLGRAEPIAPAAAKPGKAKS